jgi:LCP family protein required for cell wall assembly
VSGDGSGHAAPRVLRSRRVTVALTLLGFLLSGLAGAAVYFFPVVTAAMSITGQPIAHAPATPPAAPPAASASAAGTIPPTAVPATGRPFTVLLLGSDDGQRFAGKEVLTQSMILVRVDPATRHVTMLSIPRDLYVPLSRGGTDKIDKAYLNGGAPAAVATVERNFQVHIDHYVWIGLRGLITIIDSVGGVDVATTNPIMDDAYPDDLGSATPYVPKRIALLPGPQHLDGATALEYVRSRHDDLRSDFGRSERQQQVLTALKSKADQFGPADLPRLSSALSGELTTDLSLLDATSLLPLASGLDVPNATRIILLPPATSNGVDGTGQEVVLPHWEYIRGIVSRAFPS